MSGAQAGRDRGAWRDRRRDGREGLPVGERARHRDVGVGRARARDVNGLDLVRRHVALELGVGELRLLSGVNETRQDVEKRDDQGQEPQPVPPGWRRGRRGPDRLVAWWWRKRSFAHEPFLRDVRTSQTMAGPGGPRGCEWGIPHPREPSAYTCRRPRQAAPDTVGTRPGQAATGRLSGSGASTGAGMSMGTAAAGSPTGLTGLARTGRSFARSIARPR